MTTEIEYALMAGASYISNRALANRFPVPQSWSEIIDLRKNNPISGFEATTFTNGSEIVISYAGTNFADMYADFAYGNIPLALGNLSDQLRQAADYYLQIRALNPGAKITLTGHSLGGGLASLIAVFFDENAVTFDQHWGHPLAVSVNRDERKPADVPAIFSHWFPSVRSLHAVVLNVWLRRCAPVTHQDQGRRGLRRTAPGCMCSPRKPSVPRRVQSTRLPDGSRTGLWLRLAALQPLVARGAGATNSTWRDRRRRAIRPHGCQPTPACHCRRRPIQTPILSRPT